MYIYVYTCTQKSPVYAPKSLKYSQKSPTHTQKSPICTQKSPTYTQKSPECVAGAASGTPWNEPYIHSKEPHVLSKEPYTRRALKRDLNVQQGHPQEKHMRLYVKRALYTQYTLKRAVYTLERASYTPKRALYTLKSLKRSTCGCMSKEPCTHSK